LPDSDARPDDRGQETRSYDNGGRYLSAVIQLHQNVTDSNTA